MEGYLRQARDRLALVILGTLFEDAGGVLLAHGLERLHSLVAHLLIMHALDSEPVGMLAVVTSEACSAHGGSDSSCGGDCKSEPTHLFFNEPILTESPVELKHIDRRRVGVERRSLP